MLLRYWWMTLLRGLLWVTFGIIVFAMPRISLLMLTLFFGGFAFADGIVSVLGAFNERRQKNDNWWGLFLSGLCGIGIGLITFFSPGITSLILLFYVAIWAIGTGLLEIVTGIRLRRYIKGEVWMVLAGLASILFGVYLMARPGTGMLAILWLIAAYAIVLGIILIILSFELRILAYRLSSPPEQLAT
ncbi:MAG: HdeD family acid-resistance protein [Phycisphaerales bacterium]|nr:HdeD family acid-resistance protein [Phycisphaerales bacterium]